MATLPPGHRHEPDQSQSVAVFPGFPAAIRLAGKRLGGPANPQPRRPVYHFHLAGIWRYRSFFRRFGRMDTAFAEGPARAEPYRRSRLPGTGRKAGARQPLARIRQGGRPPCPGSTDRATLETYQAIIARMALELALEIQSMQMRQCLA